MLDCIKINALSHDINSFYYLQYRYSTYDYFALRIFELAMVCALRIKKDKG